MFNMSNKIAIAGAGASSEDVNTSEYNEEDEQSKYTAEDATQENNNQNNDKNTDGKNYENEQTQDVESKGSGNDKETSNAS
ncbi:nucleosome binding factor SPN SPT16 subunit [Staphylococcus hominis]